MADWSGVRAAIATKAAAVSGMREGTSTKLSNVTLTPSVKVTHVAQGEMVDRGAGYEMRTATVKGKLFIAKTADQGRALQDVETYAERLTVAFRDGIQLGYPTVVQDSYLASWDSGEFDYAGQSYVGADLTFTVVVRENVSRTA